MYLTKVRNTGIFGNFSQHGGGGGVFPIPMSAYLTAHAMFMTEVVLCTIWGQTLKLLQKPWTQFLATLVALHFTPVSESVVVSN